MCVTSVKSFSFGDLFDSVIRFTGIKAVANGATKLINGENFIQTVTDTVNEAANDTILGQTINAVVQGGGNPVKTVTGFYNKTPTGQLINTILSAEQVSDAVPMEEAAPSPTPDIPDNLFVLIGKALFTIAQWVAMYWLFSWLFTRFIAAKKSSTSLAHEYTPIVDQEV